MHQASTIPKAVGLPGSSFRMLRAAGAAAQVGLLDLLCAAWEDPCHLLEYNPFLSRGACATLHSAVSVWLQLCVLEDRLGRLAALAAAGADYREQLVQVGESSAWRPRLGSAYSAPCTDLPQNTVPGS